MFSWTLIEHNVRNGQDLRWLLNGNLLHGGICKSHCSADCYFSVARCTPLIADRPLQRIFTHFFSKLVKIEVIREENLLPVSPIRLDSFRECSLMAPCFVSQMCCVYWFAFSSPQFRNSLHGVCFALDNWREQVIEILWSDRIHMYPRISN